MSLKVRHVCCSNCVFSLNGKSLAERKELIKDECVASKRFFVCQSSPERVLCSEFYNQNVDLIKVEEISVNSRLKLILDGEAD